MTIICTYESPDYAATKITARYVKYDGAGGCTWAECARGKLGWLWDYRQGTCTAGDLPPQVAFAAINRRNEGRWPYGVDWPL